MDKLNYTLKVEEIQEIKQKIRKIKSALSNDMNHFEKIIPR